MNDDVCRQEQIEVIAGQVQAIGANVSGHGFNAAFAERIEGIFAKAFSHAIESVVLEHIARYSSLSAAAAWAHKQYEFTIGHASEQPLNQSRTQKACSAGDGNALPREVFSYHV